MASYELILFWDEDIVDKVMMMTDFEATLDGVVGFPSYASSERRAAYIALDEQLIIRGIVLFKIEFDQAGYPDRAWNLPLRHMAEIANPGPDLGQGMVRLACHSRSPISWHQDKLWDPSLDPQNNDLAKILQETQAAVGRFGLHYTPVSAFGAPPPSASTPSAVAPVAVAPNVDWMLERDALLKRIKEQELQNETLRTEREETVARSNYVNQQRIEILEAQNVKLLGQYKSTKAQNDALREQVEALRAQMEGSGRVQDQLLVERQSEHQQKLEALADEYHRAIAASGEEASRLVMELEARELRLQQEQRQLADEYELRLDQRLEEEMARHREQIARIDAELARRSEHIRELEGELVAMRSDRARLQQEGADQFLHQLEGMGMSFVVFHPGVGHISVPLKDLASYTENPVAYAAAKCLVTEEQYRIWLAHYENPRCAAVLGEGKCCDARVLRVESPSRFVSGESDRCARHQPNTSIDNVLRFR